MVTTHASADVAAHAGCGAGQDRHLYSTVALALLRQKFISDRIGVSSPLVPPGQNPPAGMTAISINTLTNHGP